MGQYISKSVQQGIAIAIAFLIVIPFKSKAQKDTTTWKDKFEVRGYLKSMHILNIWDGDSTLSDNFFHNRLNFRYYANENWTMGLEVRNRLFYGETKQAFGKFYTLNIDQDPGVVDMAWPLIDSRSFLLHSMIDRAWIDYSDDKWSIRIGRQRINWGQNLVWNPNDLFNVYNFSDFDYEERPGSDAIKIQRYFKKLRSLEFVYKITNTFRKDIFALKYMFNWKSYDVQLIGAKVEQDVALGLGWAGNIKYVGFKGEATYFHPYENLMDTTGILVTSMSVDYTFKNETFLTASVFYNSGGVDSPKALNNPNLFAGSTSSPKTLMPNQLSWFVQYSGQLNPLLTAGGTVIYAQGINIVFFMPNLGYSISDSWDIGLFAQSYFGEISGPFRNLGNGVFLRTRWSF